MILKTYSILEGNYVKGQVYIELIKGQYDINIQMPKEIGCEVEVLESYLTDDYRLEEIDERVKEILKVLREE